MNYVVSCLWTLSVISVPCFSKYDEPRKVKLKDVSTLTFVNGQYTTARRTRPMPQLQCVGGTAGCKFIPQTVQCENKGSSYGAGDIQWKCSADMPNKYRFGTVEVNCEGYYDRDDKDVLVGSCGLEFTIDYSKERGVYGEEKRTYYGEEKPQKSGSMLFLFIVVAAIAGIYIFCLPSTRTGGTSGPDRMSSGGPPPPGFTTGYADPYCDSTGFSQQSSSFAGGNSNIWSGLMGAGVGYMLGRRSAGQNQTSSESDTFTRRSRSRSKSPEGSRTATGFGGTKRR